MTITGRQDTLARRPLEEASNFYVLIGVDDGIEIAMPSKPDATDLLPSVGL